MTCVCSLCIILLLFCFPVLSQSKSEIKDRKIKSVTTSTFDIRKGDSTFKKNLSRYDRQGNVIESIDYDPHGNIKDHEQFQYNSHGDEVLYIQLSSDQKVMRKIESRYNKWNNLTEKITTDEGGNLSEKIELTYNPSSDPVLESTYDRDGKIIRHTEYIYDSRGMLIGKKIYNEKNILIYSKEFSIEY
ncbi:MAG: hypothetical protein ABIQ74_10795 [Chitinophagales bacterium]